jgi:hypothetical protein
MTTTKYLRKAQLAERYGGATVRTIERMILDGRLPAPTIWHGRNPLWSVEKFEEWERDTLSQRRKVA